MLNVYKLTYFKKKLKIKLFTEIILQKKKKKHFDFT